MRRHLAKLTVMSLAFTATTACLQRDVTETWYIDAAGAVTWSVHEQNVRSDAQAAVDRHSEETEYWLAVQQDRHLMMSGLRELGGEQLRTRVLRSDAPYSVVTEARFSGLDTLGQRLIASIGSTGTSLVRRTGEGALEWTLVLRDPSALGAAFEPSDGVAELLNSLEHLKVVLVSGRFEAAEGFTLSPDRRVGAFSYKQDDRKADEQAAVTLRLVWR